MTRNALHFLKNVAKYGSREEAAKLEAILVTKHVRLVYLKTLKCCVSLLFTCQRYYVSITYTCLTSVTDARVFCLLNFHWRNISCGNCKRKKNHCVYISLHGIFVARKFCGKKVLLREVFLFESPPYRFSLLRKFGRLGFKNQFSSGLPPYTNNGNEKKYINAFTKHFSRLST